MVFLKVMDLSQMQVEANASQADGSRVRVGQRVRIGLDAYPERTLTGRVHSIGALAKGGGGRNSYVRTLPIVIRVDKSESPLNPDLSAFADIVVGEASGAVIIPLAAVFEDEGESYVFVAQGGGFERRAVVRGLANHIETAIESGLEAGQTVALRRPE
jgi:HlyD family secretion protein